MRNLHITARDWMAYEVIDLDLTDVAEVAVTGLNNHGKSALLDALTWCLYGKVGRDIDQRSSDQLIRRHGAGMTSVAVSFDTSDGHAVKVVREKALGSASTLDCIIDGVSRKGHTLDDTQAVIEEWVGLPYGALVASAFMVQGESGLLGRSPRDAKDLIVRLAGAESYEPLYRLAEGKAKEAAGARAAAMQLLPPIEAVMSRADAVTTEDAAAAEALELAVLGLQAAEADLANQRVAFAAAQVQAEAYTAAEGRLARAVAAVVAGEGRIRDLEASRPGLSAAADELPPAVELPAVTTSEEVATAARSLADARSARERYMEAKAARDRLSDRLEADRARRTILPTVPCHGEGIYATCQFLVDIPTEGSLGFIESNIAIADEELEAIDAKAALVTTAEGTWVRLDREQRAYESALNRKTLAESNWQLRRENAQALLSSLDERIGSERDRLTADQAEVDNHTAELADLTDAKATLEQLRASGSAQAEVVAAARAAHATAHDRRARAAAELATLTAAQEHASALRAQVLQAESDMDLYGWLARAWHRDGVPTAIIESVIPAIEAKANEVLTRLPEDLSVELRTTRTTKTKAGFADTLEVVVTVDGDESHAALLSVGARFRVDLALRIALGEVLTRRSGRRIETLWLDEPLAALDPPSVEAMVETLNALAADFGLIVIVSHNQAFHEQVPARIRVEKVAGVSTAELVA